MVARKTDTLIDRVEETSKQTGLIAFTFNRAGYSAVKHAVNGMNQTLFGVRLFIIDEQKQRCRAFWDAYSLAHYLKHG